MPPIDKSTDSLHKGANLSEVYRALFEDAYPSVGDKKVLPIGGMSQNENVLNFSPLEAFKNDSTTVGDDVKSIVERQDKQKLEVTRGKNGELLAIVFMDFKPESSLRKENGTWVSNPPLGRGVKIDDVAVDAQGTIVLSITRDDKKFKWIHHTSGKEEMQPEK